MLSNYLKKNNLRKLKKRILKVMKEETFSVWTDWKWLIFHDNLLNHCIADQKTTEETILYVTGEYFRNMDDFRNGSQLRFHIRTEELKTSHDVNCNSWFSLSENWRDNGLVRLENLKEFHAVLHNAQNRWPQLFSGEEPEVLTYWELHFNHCPNGLHTSSPDRSREHLKFQTFSDAANHVIEYSNESYWWHSYDLSRMIGQSLNPSSFYSIRGSENKKPKLKIPIWTANQPPDEFIRIDKPDRIGWNHYWKYAADVLVAMPEETYKAIIEKSLAEKYFSSDDEFQNCWVLRQVGISMPIDNAKVPEKITFHT